MAALPTGPGADSDASIGTLVAGIQQDITRLVRGELELAKAELRESAGRAGAGAGMLGAAAFLALLAVVLISIALGYGLVALGLHPGWAFLIVAVFYLIVAAILVLLGRRRFEQIQGPSGPSEPPPASGRHFATTPRRERQRFSSRHCRRSRSWEHRYIAANGARFHVASMGDGPLIVLLHGFPEFWWAWRYQLPELAAAGWRTVAMDLRGYGGSDKTPRGYDPATLTADVSGVVRSLGEQQAVLIGHGWGGYVAWATATLRPAHVAALAVLSMPHPWSPSPPTQRRRQAGHLLGVQTPALPERRLVANDAAYVETLLRRWVGPESDFPDGEAAARYRAAMRLWPAPHCALEYHRWAVRSMARADGRRFAIRMAEPIAVPVMQVHGGADRTVVARAAAHSHRHVTGPHRFVRFDGVGHFPHEEVPDRVTDEVLDWLGTVPPDFSMTGPRIRRTRRSGRARWLRRRPRAHFPPHWAPRRTRCPGRSARPRTPLRTRPIVRDQRPAGIPRADLASHGEHVAADGFVVVDVTAQQGILTTDPRGLGAQRPVARVADDGSMRTGGRVVAERERRTIQSRYGQHRHVGTRIEVHHPRFQRFGVGCGDNGRGDSRDDVSVGHHPFRRDDEAAAFDDPVTRAGPTDHLDHAGRSRTDLRVATQRRRRRPDVANGLRHPRRDDLWKSAGRDDRFEGIAQSVGGDRHRTVDSPEDLRFTNTRGCIRNRRGRDGQAHGPCTDQQTDDGQQRAGQPVEMAGRLRRHLRPDPSSSPGQQTLTDGRDGEHHQHGQHRDSEAGLQAAEHHRHEKQSGNCSPDEAHERQQADHEAVDPAGVRHDQGQGDHQPVHQVEPEDHRALASSATGTRSTRPRSQGRDSPPASSRPLRIPAVKPQTSSPSTRNAGPR